MSVSDPKEGYAWKEYVYPPSRVGSLKMGCGSDQVPWREVLYVKYTTRDVSPPFGYQDASHSRIGHACIHKAEGKKKK